MILKDYIKKKNLTLREFAELSGLSYSLVCKLSMGNRKCSLKAAEAIYKATDGLVSKQEALWPADFQERTRCGAEQMKMFCN